MLEDEVPNLSEGRGVTKEEGEKSQEAGWAQGSGGLERRHVQPAPWWEVAASVLNKPTGTADSTAPCSPNPFSFCCLPPQPGNTKECHLFTCQVSAPLG